MFRTVPLSIIRSFSLYTQQWYMSYNFADIYRATQKKRELLKNPTKIEEIQEKKLLTEIEPLQLAF